LEPNFFIVGGSKCGTTNISYYLNLHSKVFVSKLNEPYYFCKWDLPNNFKRESMIRDEVKYLELFKNAKTEKVIGEATPSYLHSPNSAYKIKERFPDSKIIISIRNPIERAHSGYFSNEFMRKDNLSFREMIDSHKKLMDKNEFYIYNILEPGFFSKHIKRFQDNFTSDKIKVIVFEDYVKNTEKSIESILEFLELDTDFEFTEQPKRGYRIPKNKISKMTLENKTIRKISTFFIPTVTRQQIGERFMLKETEKSVMSLKERNYLKEIYEDDVKKLEMLLHRDLPWLDFH
jgi:hypothetical protein